MITTDINAAYVGGTSVSAMYLGSTKVWPSGVTITITEDVRGSLMALNLVEIIINDQELNYAYEETTTEVAVGSTLVVNQNKTKEVYNPEPYITVRNADTNELLWSSPGIMSGSDSFTTTVTTNLVISAETDGTITS